MGVCTCFSLISVHKKKAIPNDGLIHFEPQMMVLLELTSSGQEYPISSGITRVVTRIRLTKWQLLRRMNRQQEPRTKATVKTTFLR